MVTSTNFHPLVGQGYPIRGQVQLVSATDGGAATYTPFPTQPVTLQLCTAACYSQTPTRTSSYVVRARASNGLAVSHSKLAKILVR